MIKHKNCAIFLMQVNEVLIFQKKHVTNRM